jgi:hypothetical protein
VYRGSDPDFTPDEDSRVHMTTSTQWEDPEYDGWSVYYKITAVDFSGNEGPFASVGTTTGTGDRDVPKHHMLYQNVPNPFNPATTISFELREAAEIMLAVYDPSGHLVRVLESGSFEAQRYDVEWDGTDVSGQPVASGVYFYRLRAGSEVLTRKAVLLK